MKIYKKEINGWGRYPQKECNLLDLSYDEGFGFDEAYTYYVSRGMGRSYGDASLGDGDALVINLRWRNKVIAFNKKEGIIRVQAGISIERLLEIIIPYGWFIPVTPGTSMVSMGGAVASNVHGKNQHKVGAIAEFIVSLAVYTEQGLLECSRQENVDLFLATIGGYGLTGRIDTVTIKLKPISSTLIKVKKIRVKNIDDALSVLDTHDADWEHSLVWIDCFGKGNGLGRGIVMLGEHVKDAKAELPLRLDWSRSYSVSRFSPKLFDSGWVNRAFNFAVYRHMRRTVEERLSGIESWFYPLDSLSDWNHLYGKRGFVQYQFAIDRKYVQETMEKIIQCLQNYGGRTFVAGLKRTKKDSPMLPFCMEGYTFAMDLSCTQQDLLPMLDEFDQIILESKGRCYLTKDSRLAPETFRKMYPEYEAWKAVVRKYAPEGRFYSSMAQRLEL